MGQSAAVTAGGGVHGFPAELTSFIGRSGPVREVARLLEQSRLVTVTGPGGSGKTRVASEVARQVAGRLADGVWLAELAAVQDPAQVMAAVVAALGIQEQPGVPAANALARVLARQQLLLVLDNCEHVIGAAARLCAGLLPAADDVRILATSREPLRVAGETRYRLAPLTLPSPDDPVGVGGSEAVALFADRARQADSRFALNGETGPAVARLVARLDGMPLAIELAAARVEALGVAQLLDRLDDRFALLTAGDRLAAARHRSLAATVEWSYQLLDDDGRRVFRQVSVFPGPFTLEAAEAVTGPGTGPITLHLVDCSLLVPPQAGPDDRSRYGMHETLRAYGIRLLAETGEDATADAAMAQYALQVAEDAAAGLDTGIGELAAARRLDAEDAMMRQALAWAMDHDAATALSLAVALAPWWLLRGRLPGGYPLLREAASRAEVGSSKWCAAQLWLGEMAESLMNLPGALGHFTAVRDAIQGREPSRALAGCLAGRAGTFANLGRFAEAAEDGRRALSLARKLDDPAAVALGVARLTTAALYAGDLDAAMQLARQTDENPPDIPGWLARDWSCILTMVLTRADDLGAAERVCAAGLARCRAVGDLQALGAQLTLMATLEMRTGRAGDAAAHLQEALQTAIRTGNRVGMVNGVESCGYLCAETGRYADAVTVWAALAGLARREGFTEPPAEVRRRDEPLRAARQALGAARTQAAGERGAAMSMATAVEYALMLTDPHPPQSAAPRPGKLSARERELVTLVAQGRTDAQIAAQLYISIRTVRSHLDRIRDKTGCRRRADLTRLALQAGLV